MNFETEILQAIIGDGILAVVVYLLINRISNKLDKVLTAIEELKSKM